MHFGSEQLCNEKNRIVTGLLDITKHFVFCLLKWQIIIWPLKNCQNSFLIMAEFILIFARKQFHVLRSEILINITQVKNRIINWVSCQSLISQNRMRMFFFFVFFVPVGKHGQEQMFQWPVQIPPGPNKAIRLIVVIVYLFLTVGYRHLPSPAGWGCALVDRAPQQAAAVPRDPGVSC